MSKHVIYDNYMMKAIGTQLVYDRLSYTTNGRAQQSAKKENTLKNPTKNFCE